MQCGSFCSETNHAVQIHVVKQKIKCAKCYVSLTFFASLFPSGLPPRTFALTVSSVLLGFYLYFSLFFRFLAVR